MKILYACFVLIPLLLSACGGTMILKASFQEDSYNSPPNATLPGEPEGDSLRLVDIRTNTIVRWTNQPANNTSKAVRISSEPMGFSGIELIPASGEQREKFILAFNVYAQIMNNRDFVIRARTSPFDSGMIAEIKFLNGNVFVKNSGQYQRINGVDYAVSEITTVAFSVDFSQGSCNAAILNSSGSGNAQNIPIPSGSTSAGIYFQVGFDGDAGSGLPGVFVADDFLIKKS